MDVFTPVSTTITTFSCRYCGGSHKGKSGMEIHLKTQKHKDAVQKQKRTIELFWLIRTTEKQLQEYYKEFNED